MTKEMTPTELLQRELKRITDSAFLREEIDLTVAVAALELALADAEMLGENHFLSCICDKCENQRDARSKLNEALQS